VWARGAKKQGQRRNQLSTSSLPQQYHLFVVFTKRGSSCSTVCLICWMMVLPIWGVFLRWVLLLGPLLPWGESGCQTSQSGSGQGQQTSGPQPSSCSCHRSWYSQSCASIPHGLRSIPHSVSRPLPGPYRAPRWSSAAGCQVKEKIIRLSRDEEMVW